MPEAEPLAAAVAAAVGRPLDALGVVEAIDLADQLRAVVDALPPASGADHTSPPTSSPSPTSSSNGPASAPDSPSDRHDNASRGVPGTNHGESAMGTTAAQALTTPPAPPPETVPPAPLPVVPPASGCDPNYSGCVPPFPPDVDCRDVGETVTVLGEDPHGLDGDNDGLGCE